LHHASKSYSAGPHALQLAQLDPAGAECKNTEKLEAGKAKRTATKAEADAERAAKLAKALAEKERVATNRTEEEVENEKEARVAQAAQRKKDRDIKLY
jgi:hypothetical protein